LTRDLYTRLGELDEPTVRDIADILEVRGRHPQQVDMRAAYLGALGDVSGQRVLEVGCGTGVVGRDIAQRVGRTGSVTGIDPTVAFIEVAERLRIEARLDNAAFSVHDGKSLPFENGSFDLAAAVTVLCHLPERESVLREMVRVTRPGGTVLIVDGEYEANQVEHSDRQMTQRIVDAWHANAIDDPRLMRRIVPFIEAAGLRLASLRGHVHLEAGHVDEATSFIWQWCLFAARLATEAGAIDAVQSEAWVEQLRAMNRRAELFGTVTYVSVIAHRP
jgi:ubiquinone/menaquinone biosynthesis C-methylase UbiE